MKPKTFLLLVVILLVSAPLRAQAFSGLRYFISAGLYQEYIPFSGEADDTYNSYINRYYGNDGVYVSCTKLAVGINFLIPKMSENGPIINAVDTGIEYFEGDADLPFTSLNGQEKENRLDIEYTKLTLGIYKELLGDIMEIGVSGGFRFVLGYGFSRLKRTFYGTSSESITTSNVDSQEGRLQSTTVASLLSIESGIQLSVKRVDIIFLLGYKTSKHTIPKTDNRPAKDTNNIITESTFDLSGFYSSAELRVVF